MTGIFIVWIISCYEVCPVVGNFCNSFKICVTWGKLPRFVTSLWFFSCNIFDTNIKLINWQTMQRGWMETGWLQLYYLRSKRNEAWNSSHQVWTHQESNEADLVWAEQFGFVSSLCFLKAILELRFYNCLIVFSFIIVLKAIMAILSFLLWSNFSLSLTNHVRNASVNILIIWWYFCIYFKIAI